MSAGTMVAGLLTLAVLTFLYRDNPLYKMAEYILVGVSIGYALVVAWNSTMMDLLLRPLFSEGRLDLLIPLVLGLLVFGRFHPKTTPLSRIPLAVLIGSGAGAAIPAMLGPRVLTQLSGTVASLTASDSALSLSGLIVFLGLVATLAYFYFSHEHKGVLGKVAYLGTFFLMIFFGTTFGYTVMSRMSTFIGRIEFLLTDLFHLTH